MKNAEAYFKTNRINNRKDKAARDSGIELLKVFAIFLIIFNHVVNTLNNSTYINLSLVTTDLQYLILAIARTSGLLGNWLFFTCSAWFFLDCTKSNKRKLLQILADNWVISVLIFIVVFFDHGEQLGEITILRQFFPTTFGNNWYITCYLIFSLLYPFLNSVIAHLDQKTLLRVCVVLLMLYFVLSYFIGGAFTGGSLFYSSKLIQWVTVYFVVAYLKYYLPGIMDSPSVNRMLLIIGIGGHCIMILFTDLLGFYVDYYSDKLQRWSVSYSPFYLMAAIALFNFTRNTHFRSKLVNQVSGLSYLIYIIHENVLLPYYRGLMWNYVHDTFGFKYLLLWTLILTAVVFVFAFCCALLYEQTIQRLVARFCDCAYPRIAQTWYRIENWLLRLH